MSVPLFSPSNSVSGGSSDSATPISASNALVQAYSTLRVSASASPAKRVHSRRNRASSSAGIRSACSRSVAADRFANGSPQRGCARGLPLAWKARQGAAPPQPLQRQQNIIPPLEWRKDRLRRHRPLRQRRHGAGRRPAVAAVVEDDGQQRRRPVAALRQALARQAAVVAHAPRHVLVHRGLKLQEHDQFRAGAPPRHAPRHVAEALREAAIGRLDVCRGQLLGPVEVEFGGQRRRDQAQQVREQLAVPVGELVDAVVVHAAPR